MAPDRAAIARRLRGAALASLPLVGACAASAPTAPLTPAASAPPPRPVAEPPPKAACVIEGDGEPIDNVLYHVTRELSLAATRGGPPLVRAIGDARHTLHGRWSELGAVGGDGLARLELERANVVRVAGYAELSAVRFRLRSEVSVVPDHVFLQPNALVEVAAAEDDVAHAIAEVPFQSPKRLSASPRCADLAYDGRADDDAAVEEPRRPKPTGTAATIRLYDAPWGRLRFEADVGLVYVTELEQRDGYARIDAERHRVRLAGWMPVELISHEARGSGHGAGTRSYSMSRPRGRDARTARATPLLARAEDGAAATMGELAPGAKVVVLGEGADLVPIALADGLVGPVGGATMLVARRDLAD